MNLECAACGRRLTNDVTAPNAAAWTLAEPRRAYCAASDACRRDAEPTRVMASRLSDFTDPVTGSSFRGCWILGVDEAGRPLAERCPLEFGPDLGPEYRCLLPVGHGGRWHVDQYENQWRVK